MGEEDKYEGRGHNWIPRMGWALIKIKVNSMGGGLRYEYRLR